MNDAQLLGISPPPVAGSPVVTTEMATIYWVAFFVILVILYIIFHYVKKPLLLAHKLKLALAISIILKASFISMILILGAFFLVPNPKITDVTPKNENGQVTNNPAIAVFFDRPVNRASLQKSITPEVPGIWTFEDPIYATHLYRKLVFHPNVTLRPNTVYTVNISNISNFVKITKPSFYSYSFKTKPSPMVTTVSPKNGLRDISIGTPIEISLSSEDNSESVFNFEFSPGIEFDKKLHANRKLYTLVPKKKLDQGEIYKLKVVKTDVLTHISSNTIVERGNALTLYEGSFTTKETPGIKSFTPSGVKVFTTEPIRISFSQDMDRRSVENNFSLSPALPGRFIWQDDRNVMYQGQNLAYNTSYTMRIPENTLSKSGGYLTTGIRKTFTTIGNVIVEKTYPEDGTKAVGTYNQIKFVFDQEVDKKDAESKFSITPKSDGNFSWEGNTMVFNPSLNLKYSTDYVASVAAGVKSIRGLNSGKIFATQFRTQDETIKLGVPAFLQKYSLSCEIAALRMALGFRGIKVSEDKLIEQVGFDPTPKKGNIWGDPNLAFVGEINGRQMVTGYGVYWEPIAKVARRYRNAEAFQGWSIQKLAQNIKDNNPVIVWAYSLNGSPAGWNTIQGNPIYAVRGEHAVVAVGYVGEVNNPTSIIVNDPLFGQVQWNRSYFEKKWGVFGQSGVVVY